MQFCRMTQLMRCETRDLYDLRTSHHNTPRKGVTVCFILAEYLLTNHVIFGVIDVYFRKSECVLLISKWYLIVTHVLRHLTLLAYCY